MTRKLFFGGIAAGVLTLLVAFTSARSYLKTAFNDVKDNLKGAVPLEFEIKRARTLVKDVGPEINHYKHVIITEEVVVEKLRKEIAEGEKFLAAKEDEVRKLAGHLKSNQSEYQFASRTYTAEQVKTDVATRLSTCKAKKAELTSRKAQLAAKERVLVAAREKLHSMDAKKRELEAKIEMLEANLEEVKARETATDIAVDDSELSRTKELIDEIDTQIQIRKKMVDSSTNDPSEIPVNAPSNSEEDLSKQVNDYFKDSPSPANAEDVNPKT